MTTDDPFDGDLHATLEGLAREPAPEELVSRVAAIPSQVPAAPGPMARLLATLRGSAPGFVAVAAVVVLAVVAVAFRPASGPPVGGSPSVAIVPSPEATTEPSPSSTAAAPASSTPSQKPTPSPTQVPIAGGPVPDAFEPLSVTFVSASDGWVLGRGACGDAACPLVARTADGGHTWTSIGAPPTNVASLGMDEDPGSGVAGLRFANTTDGWAFGPGLWATHDGGSSWVSVKVPGIPAAGKVVGLETSHGLVHAVIYDGNLFRIASSEIGADRWALAPIRIDLGGGPVPTVQLALSGDAGWVLVNNRIVIAGARLEAGGWTDWRPPCATVNGSAVLDASSATELVAVCDVGAWGDPGGQPMGEHAYTSHDGGLTFARTGAAPPVDQATEIASTGPHAFVLAGGDARGTILVGSFDTGRTWKTLLQPVLEQVSELGFTTSSQGVLILTDDQGTARLFMTRDGGRSWNPVRFQP
jgi:hypothetical protein